MKQEADGVKVGARPGAESPAAFRHKDNHCNNQSRLPEPK
jgi:hypothetical protein